MMFLLLSSYLIEVVSLFPITLLLLISYIYLCLIRNFFLRVGTLTLETEGKSVQQMVNEALQRVPNDSGQLKQPY